MIVDIGRFFSLWCIVSVGYCVNFKCNCNDLSATFQHGLIQRCGWGSGTPPPAPPPPPTHTQTSGKSQVTIGFPKKYWYGLPREAIDPKGVQLLLEGSSYGPLRNTLMTKTTVVRVPPPPPPSMKFSGSAQI